MRAHMSTLLAGLALGIVIILATFCLSAPAASAQVPPSGTPGASATPQTTLTPRPIYPRVPRETATPRPYTAIPRNTPAPIVYLDPAVLTTDGIWIGVLNSTANVRSGAGYDYSVRKVWYTGRRVLVFGSYPGSTPGTNWYQVGHYPEPDLYISSSLVSYVAPLQMPNSYHPGRWIDVNLTQQTLIAFEDSQPVMVAQIASGKKGHETVVGQHRIYWRLPLQDMAGGGALDGSPYYRLKNVPWVQYFEQSGDSLHGAFWHDNFGTPMSHGCVNLSAQNANWLWDWDSLGTLVNVDY